MKDHLHYIGIPNCLSERKTKIKNLKVLLNLEREIDQNVANAFPMDKFGEPEELLLVEGSKDLIEKYLEIDEVKIDIPESLGNIEYVGLSSNEQIILNFKNDDEPSFTGTYDFTKDFFEDLFSMSKYANFCIDNDYTDILKENIERLLEKMQSKEMQFRLIKKDDNYYLRGLTSTKYKNYDNHLSLYLSLLAMHKFAKDNDVVFCMREMHLSDSALKVFFEQKTAFNIKDVGSLYFGIFISNSEIRTSNFTFELRYRLVDSVDENVSFAAIPPLSESVFRLDHKTGLDKVIMKLDRAFLIEELRNKMLKYIEAFKKIDKLTSDEIFNLVTIIQRSQDFCKTTKNKAKDMYDQNIINNSLTLMKCFNKLKDITDDLDERIQLERIYYELINNLR